VAVEPTAIPDEHSSCPSATTRRVEKRTDIYLSTLRGHIEAMGGELDLVARFPDGAVKISTFADLGGNPTP